MITHRNLIGFKPNRRDKAPSFNVCSVEVIWRECRWIVLFLVGVCWWRVNKYKPSKWLYFRILHHNKVQNIIQCHDNNILKQMCIKILCCSTETYIWYNVQRGKTGRNIYVSSKSRIGPIPKNKGMFFAMYQRMRSKGTSWAGPRHIIMKKNCSKY